MRTAGRPASVLVFVVASGLVASLYLVVTVLASFTAFYAGTRGLIQLVLAFSAGPWIAAWLSRRALARDGHELSVPSLAIGATVGLVLAYVIGYGLGVLSQRGIIQFHDPLETILIFALWILGPFMGALGLSLITARRASWAATTHGK